MLLTTSPVQTIKNQDFFKDKVFNYQITSVPTVTSEIDELLSANSYLAVDAKSNSLLFEKNSNEKLPIASLTKIMTALLILEKCNLNSEVIISKNVLNKTFGVRLWLIENERITVENLLKAMLVMSANDAALALAEYYSGSIEAFVDVMNNRAKELNMKNTHFTNPAGFDDFSHYSTSNDLLLLTRSAWRNSDFRRIVNIKDTTIYSKNYKERHITSTNKLLGNEIKGVKTGTTDQAGQCLILYVEKGKKGFFTIVLGSKKRFEDSKVFIENIWDKIQW